MTVQDEVIDISLGFDANYAVHAAAVIASVSRYGKNSRFRFLVLHEGVGLDLQKQIEQLAPNGTFVWIEIGDDDVPAFEARRHLTRSTLYRLGLENLAPPDCRRVLYLDSDITVIGDVSDLWRADMQGKALGAVIDGYLAANYDNGQLFHERWNLPFGKYFNAGILLIDLQQVRERKLFSQTIKFVAEHDYDLPFNDQDALNYVFHNAWLPLSVAWNVQRPQAVFWEARIIPEEVRLGDQRPLIVHYTGPEKPWLSTGYHPWSWIYWESLAHTPFFESVAKKYGVNRLKRIKLWLRWMRRRPKHAKLVGCDLLSPVR